MNTIKNNCNNELIIKNSKFICYLYKINNKNEVDYYLSNLKKEYKDATHHCYAYILNDTKKASDDGEPGGTAGMPILLALEHNNLTNVLAVVIRYFGGIKLGPGGLVRAYTKSVIDALNQTHIVNLIKGYNVDIFFEYKDTSEIDYLLKNTKINKKEFLEHLKYNIDADDEILNKLIQKNINYNIIKDIYIEK